MSRYKFLRKIIDFVVNENPHPQRSERIAKLLRDRRLLLAD